MNSDVRAGSIPVDGTINNKLTLIKNKMENQNFIQIGEIEKVVIRKLRTAGDKGNKIVEALEATIDKLQVKESFVITLLDNSVYTIKSYVNKAVANIIEKQQLKEGVLKIGIYTNAKDKDGKVISIRVFRTI